MTIAHLELQCPDVPPSDWLLAVDTGLDRYNHETAPVADVKRLAVFATVDGTVVGGAVGRTWGRCCELLELWVDATRRKSGIGSALVTDFEARGRDRGCDIFYLTTLSFQAPDFYRRHGYGVLAQISGYPDGIVKYLMHKTTTTA